MIGFVVAGSSSGALARPLMIKDGPEVTVKRVDQPVASGRQG